MPYILQEDREELTGDIGIRPVLLVGELNYLITLKIIEFFNINPKYHQYHSIKEAQIQMQTSMFNKVTHPLIIEINTIYGIGEFSLITVLAAFNAVIVEFERRVIAPYEDLKREENGDVYPEHLLKQMRKS